MNPKMTSMDAARCLGKSEAWVFKTLQERKLPFSKTQNQVHFGYEASKSLFQLSFTPKIIVFQIVKGGTGKTSLVYEFAARASLYGAKVLCVDMDQQGNLTHAFDQNAEALPVMIDVLVDNHSLEDTIISVAPGIDLLPSRFENAMLDEALRIKKLPLETIYRKPLQKLKNRYDVIVVDCPPSLGQSVTACALAADAVLAPVTPEPFAMSGLEIARKSLEELEENFGISIPFKIVLNKFETRSALSQQALHYLSTEPQYCDKILNNYIRLSQEFPKAIAKGGSIFDSIKPTIAKEDVDCLTQELLNLFSYRSISDVFSSSAVKVRTNKSKKSMSIVKSHGYHLKELV